MGSVYRDTTEPKRGENGVEVEGRGFRPVVQDREVRGTVFDSLKSGDDVILYFSFFGSVGSRERSVMEREKRVCSWTLFSSGRSVRGWVTLIEDRVLGC